MLEIIHFKNNNLTLKLASLPGAYLMRQIFGTYPDPGEWIWWGPRIYIWHIPPSWYTFSENYQPSWPNYTNIPDYSIFLHMAFLPWDFQVKMIPHWFSMRSGLLLFSFHNVSTSLITAHNRTYNPSLPKAAVTATRSGSEVGL